MVTHTQNKNGIGNSAFYLLKKKEKRRRRRKQGVLLQPIQSPHWKVVYAFFFCVCRILSRHMNGTSAERKDGLFLKDALHLRMANPGSLLNLNGFSNSRRKDKIQFLPTMTLLHRSDKMWNNLNFPFCAQSQPDSIQMFSCSNYYYMAHNMLLTLMY